MTQAAIRKPAGLDDLVRRYTPAKPEEERKVATVGENPFPALLKKYEAFLGRWEEFLTSPYYQWDKDYVHTPSADILSSEEINLFLQTTIPFEERKKYSELTGMFITRLIQSSYAAGHNDFQLATQVIKELDHLGAYLKGNNKRKLHISIIGNVGSDCGYDANNVNFNITGNVGKDCGNRANNSNFNITGNVGKDCGTSARYSDFYLTNRVGSGCGRHAEEVSFRTSNVKTLKSLLRQLRTPGNYIIYIHDGKEEVMRER